MFLRKLLSVGGTQWIWLMAASTVMVLPLIIFFFSAQRYYWEGIQMAGIAGR